MSLKDIHSLDYTIPVFASLAQTNSGGRHRTLFFRDPEGNLLEIYAEY